MGGRAATAIGLALALAAPARGDGEPEVRARAWLHLRWTGEANLPSPEVLFDPASRAFAVASYLGPAPREGFGAAFLGAAAEGSHLDGRLHWVIAADSGFVRTRRLAQAVVVCPSSSTPSGLDFPSGSNCILPLRFALPSTVPGPRQLTSNGLPIEEEARQTLFLREAYFEAELGQAGFLSVAAGRKRITVGDGFIYDDYGLGLDLEADLGAVGPPLEVGLSLFWPTRGRIEDDQRRSYLAAIHLGWLPSLFEQVGAFAAFSHDETGGVSQILRLADEEALVVRLRGSLEGSSGYRTLSRLLAALESAPRSGTSDLFWAGLSGHLLLGLRHELSWTGALLFGRSVVTLPLLAMEQLEPRVTPVEGQLARVRWRFRPWPEAAFGAFFLFQSGGLPPAERLLLGQTSRYHGFLAVSPYVTDLNLFFNGGIDESFSSRRATAPGVNGRGVLAPGLLASWEPAEAFQLQGRGAWLVADEVGPFGGRVYGTEVDLNATWSPGPWLALLAEADVLFPGSFFPGGAPVRRFILGVNVTTP